MNERNLEEYICQHPLEALPGLSIIKRQATVPHGVIDLIGWQEYSLDDLHIARPVIIELKAVVMLPKHVSQLLRYCFDLEALLSQSELVGFDRVSEWQLQPVLICPAWTQAAIAACAYSEVAIVHWQENGNGTPTFVPIEPWDRCIAHYWRRPPIWFAELVKCIQKSQ